MDNLINRLREAKTLADADPVLTELHAIRPVRKLVEASIIQRMNPNPASYEYGLSMLNEAIQYLDKEEEPVTPESPGLKVQDNHFKEEILDNDKSNRNTGSEGSTESTEPYSGEGTKTGDEDMTNSPNTENQMSETNSPFPNDLKEMDGLHPDLAKQMSAKMPTIPPMNTGDQMKQTRYTIQQYHTKYTIPLIKHSKVQDIAIKKLSEKIRETEAKNGTYTLDMDMIKSNSPARVRETVQSNPLEQATNLRAQNKDYNLNERRNEIRLMNNQMSEE